MTIKAATTLPVPGVSRYSNAFTVTWGAEPSTNAAPVSDYDVVVTDLATLEERTCLSTGATTCTVSGFTPPDPLALPIPYLPTYSVKVTARNAIGASTASTLPLVSLALPPGRDLRRAGGATAPAVLATAGRRHLVRHRQRRDGVRPRLHLGAAGRRPCVGRPRWRPGAMSVALDGGVLAAWIDVSATRPSSFSLGLNNPEMHDLDADLRLRSQNPEERAEEHRTTQYADLSETSCHVRIHPLFIPLEDRGSGGNWSRILFQPRLYV